jgi:coproporphyrinogen III oxidase-like Fe-S oxidoreductase
MSMLRDNNFDQYEVSAFALNDKKACHNMNYWEFGDYLGIGAGAHGKITIPEQSQVIRTTKTRQPDHYLARVGDPIVTKKPIAIDEIALEFMMNGLRLKGGVPSTYFAQRTGISDASIKKAVLHLQSQGLMEQDSAHYRTTAMGYQFLNTVLEHF